MPDTATFYQQIKVSELGKKASEFTVSATPEECSALAERFGLATIGAVSATLKVLDLPRKEGVKITGQLKASIVHRSTVSLKDVPEDLDLPFELLLVSAEVAARMDNDGTLMDPDAIEYDALEGDDVDLGEIVAQTLSVSMDQYPRAAGEEVEIPKSKHLTLDEPELVKPNPFAVLEGLKDKS
ncbi:MAG: DUF177 domain-containing protein [Kordiimonadaceae bacterium]|nr:DUF177 domain-containing protein [Kordiimonadaceae bacterium]